ncbi:MAG: dynamin family protein [Anaerolineae bacterium]|nr:dynamin family protein [Anaerolineae bacterium]
MEQRLVPPAYETILSQERHWLTQMQIALASFPAVPEDRAALEKSVHQLDELFLLVVVGEFNSGKSAFINALFGQSLLKEGVTPTTTRVNLLKYGTVFEKLAESGDIDVYAVPASLLRDINIVDTPGTNAIQREHEAITQEFVPRSDMVLFITSVDRPFTESERAFLESIRNWGKKVVIVLNKIDILEDEEDIDQISTFIAENAQALLGISPRIFPVSARRARQARETQDTALLESSRLPELEAYIFDTLDEKERLKLKLQNPIGVGMHLASKYLDVVDARLEVLRDDIEVMDAITRQLDIYREDMLSEFNYRLSDVDLLLQEFENCGIAYFDEMLRLVRIKTLLNTDELERQFKAQVVADVPEEIERKVQALTEWLVERNHTQWKAVVDSVGRQQAKHTRPVVGQLGGSFEVDRAGLIEGVRREAQQAMRDYSQVEEARRIAGSLQRAVANTALAEVGAVGLGTIIAVLATSSALDITGIVAAGTMAVLGLLIIPSRKRRSKGEFREKVAGIREHLTSTLRVRFETELDRSLQLMKASVAPYTRFIRAQQQQLDEQRETFTTIRAWLHRQQEDLEAL